MNHDRHPKIADTDHDVIALIRERWSPRAFDVTTPIADAEIRSLFEAARWAPSSANEQPWRFVFTDVARTPVGYAALLDALAPKNRAWAQNAPVLVLVTVRATFERQGFVNRLAHYDTGQAVGFLTLQATAIGLAVRQMQGFDPDRAREACAVPEGFEPAVVMAIGRRGAPDQLEIEAHRAAELQPRQRRPLAEFVFSGTWGERFEV